MSHYERAVSPTRSLSVRTFAMGPEVAHRVAMLRRRRDGVRVVEWSREVTKQKLDEELAVWTEASI